MKPRLLKYFALLALTLGLAGTLHCSAQSSLPKLNDPANLAGERVSAPDLADTLPIDHGAPALEQLLRTLRTRASFMLIVAHPDDEDGGMLTYLSRGQGARVAMLTLTRGEGGQNLMSGDFEDALGLIRTQELLAADRYMGVDQFFGTEVDFGFSKTKEEAFAKWTHERVLYDAVRAVRLYRPLVIASVFIGAPTDGHGQHQVSGEIAQEVFNAAGDPKVFPDQNLPPWQPLKVYARVPFARIDAQGMFDYATNQYATPRFENYVTGKVTETVPAANVMVAEGTTDALLGGLSYVQFAREGLALQKTQIGPGVRRAAAGRVDVRYHRYGSRVLVDGKPQPDDGGDTGMESGFFEGIDTSLPGIASLAPEAADKLRPALEKIDREIADAQANFDPNHLDAIAPQLRAALGAVDDIVHELENPKIDDLLPVESYSLLHELRIKRVQLNNALVLALGITFTTDSPDLHIIQNSDASANVRLSQASSETVLYKTLSSDDGFGNENRRRFELQSSPNTVWPGKPLFTSCGLSSDQTTLYTAPYFIRDNIEDPVYRVVNPSLRNAPAAPPAFSCYLELTYRDVPLTVGSAVGHNGQPLQVVPPISVEVSPRVRILPTNQDHVTLHVTIQPPHRAYLGQPDSSLSFHDSYDADSGVTTFEANVPRGRRRPVTFQAGAMGLEFSEYASSYRAVGYGDLTRTNYYTPATLKVIPVDVTTAQNLHVAYLPGTGDDVPSALSDLGVTPHILTVADLTPDKLKQYDAVVLGVRPYEAHPELAGADAVLKDYAANGGVVIAQYVARQMPDGAAPYSLSLGSNEKVVDETAPVAILDPSDPLLNWPNKITNADFSGWVEERGHGFMNSWDPHFKPLLETHDPGQQSQQGGLLVARTGKGAWIYLAYALYRQLPEGVPGSYRLLANLISAGKEPIGK